MLCESSAKDQNRILLIAISLMIAVSVIVLTLTLWMLYRSNFEQQLESLHAMVREQVTLIESVARFDAGNSREALEQLEKNKPQVIMQELTVTATAIQRPLQ